jgi:hypothetical protein
MTTDELKRLAQIRDRTRSGRRRPTHQSAQDLIQFADQAQTDRQWLLALVDRMEVGLEQRIRQLELDREAREDYEREQRERA